MSEVKPPPHQDYHGALCIVLLYGPKRARFLMSEVPLGSNIRPHSP